MRQRADIMNIGKYTRNRRNKTEIDGKNSEKPMSKTERIEKRKDDFKVNKVKKRN